MEVVKFNSHLLKSSLTNDEKPTSKLKEIPINISSSVTQASFSQTKLIGEYVVDKKFTDHFQQLKQVFMYITDKCNIECEQCIYKPSINHYINEEIPLDDALALLETFQALGATKVTFLGGEPTLYGHREKRKPLLKLIKETKKMGYEYVRLDSNGQAISRLLPEADFQNLDEIAFSLDGFSTETNDMLRGKGTFPKVIESIKQAIDIGYRVTVTCCVHKLLLTRDENDIYLIEKMIRFVEDLGVYQINFHDLFKAGVPMDTWTGNFDTTPEEWVVMYDEMSEKIFNNNFDIDIRLPQCFITQEKFDSNAEFFGYCPVKLGERVMVHPNGVIRICSNLICTGFGAARYENRNIKWDDTHNNEIAGHELDKNTPCTNRSRHKKYGKLVPLCFSFKPDQNEHVWKNKLEWDDNKNSGNPDV